MATSILKQARSSRRPSGSYGKTSKHNPTPMCLIVTNSLYSTSSVIGSGVRPSRRGPWNDFGIIIEEPARILMEAKHSHAPYYDTCPQRNYSLWKPTRLEPSPRRMAGLNDCSILEQVVFLSCVANYPSFRATSPVRLRNSRLGYLPTKLQRTWPVISLGSQGTGLIWISLSALQRWCNRPFVFVNTWYTSFDVDYPRVGLGLGFSWATCPRQLNYMAWQPFASKSCTAFHGGESPFLPDPLLLDGAHNTIFYMVAQK